jgi:putative nucleotidyltransferase with HDIG domain
MVSGQRHIARRPFAYFLIFMGLWGIFIFMMRSSSDLTTALLWEKFVFFAILSAALVFYRFTIAMTGNKEDKKILYPLYGCYFISVALIPTNLLVSDMQMMWYGKAPVIGPLFFLYVLCVYVPLVLSLIVLFKHYQVTRNIKERIRYSYIIVGLFAMFIGGTTDYLPSLGVNIYPLGIIGNILFCIMATIAMLRYGLLEMRVVLRKGATYSIISMVIFGVFGSLIFLLSSVFQVLLNPISLAITISAVFLVAAALQPVLLKVQRMVDRWFYRERYDHLQALKQFTRETKDITELKELTSSLVNMIAQGMQSRGVYLLLPAGNSDNFTTYAYSGEKINDKLPFYSNSPFIVTMKYQDSLIDANDIDAIPLLNSLSSRHRDILTKNSIELLVPIKMKNRLVGILLLGSKPSFEPYSVEDRSILQKVSHEAAISIENAKSYDSVQRERGELQKAMEGTIYAMCAVVEMKDPYTADHQRRVASLACAIAREIGLSEWRINGIRVAGLLHDVGKMVVPAEILSKPGKISEHEFSIIKTHPIVGYEILKKVEFPWPVTDAILQHHERLDGSGYPNGLSGDQITLEAKILGAADVVEAMSSHRPYRPSLGIDNALAQLEQNKNVLYDPDVVEACLALFHKKKFEFEQAGSEFTTDFVKA